jgi:chaperonin cofactor prefoldin
MEKTPQETLQELDYKIDRLEKSIAVVNNQLLLDNSHLDRLKEQRKSLLNYLNTDND